jgi:parallel beta-helix repeat protein
MIREEKTFAFLLAALFLTSLTSLLSVTVTAQSQELGVIKINADGSVIPPTPLIQQTGDTYTVTSDMKVHVQIFLQKSNMIFDGKDHTIGDGQVGNIVVGPYVGEGVSNVTIKNFYLNQTFTDGITIRNSINVVVQNNTIIGGRNFFGQTNGVILINCASSKVLNNTINGPMCGIDLLASKDNLIAGNLVNAVTFWTWSHYPTAIMIDIRYNEGGETTSGSINNLIYGNTFLSTGNLTTINDSPSNRWDNGTTGNFWGDYQNRYPNASQIGITGVGNTPYFIAINNVDHYPLLSQSLSFPTPIIEPTTSPTSSPTPTPSVPEFSWLMILPLFLSILSIAVLIRSRKPWKVTRH